MAREREQSGKIAALSKLAATALLATLVAGAAQAEGDARRGKDLAAVWCTACHQIADHFPTRSVGPPFSSFAQNPRYTTAYLRDWIVFPHSTMPNFKFSDEVLSDLVAYIRSLKSPEGLPCESCSPEAGERGYAIGSGFFISAQGAVLTANHNLKACERVTVQSPGELPVTAVTVRSDPGRDLALLHTGLRPLHHAKIRAANLPVLGETLVTYSFPLAGILSDKGVLSAGHVAAVNGAHDNRAEFQMSANIQPGSSGGPVLDSWGLVIGVAKSRLVAGNAMPLPGINFAVSPQEIRLFLAASGLPVGAVSARPRLQIEGIVAIAKTFTVRVTCWR